VGGKCTRDLEQLSPALSWQLFLDSNPDAGVVPVTFGFEGVATPAPKCSFDLTTGIPTGWANYYVARYIRSFFTCISLYDTPYFWTNYSMVTHETFGNKSSRDIICNGKEGMCTSSFCDDLYANMTKYTPSFCGALETGVSELKRCMRDFRVNAPSLYSSVYYADQVKTTTVRSEDYDYTYALRKACVLSSYNDNAGGLLTNTAVFVKCPMLPKTLTEGARFSLGTGQFSNSLGWTEAGAKACLVTYGGSSLVSASAAVGVVMVAVSFVAGA